MQLLPNQMPWPRPSWVTVVALVVVLEVTSAVTATVALMDAAMENAEAAAEAVLVAVLRQRAPTETSGPHNSWCLVTFSEITIVDSVMAGQETSRIPTGVNDGRGVYYSYDPPLRY